MERLTWTRAAMREQLGLDFDRILKEYELLRKKGHLLQKVKETAERKLQVVKKRYEQKTVSVNDFKNAELELTEAELNCSRLLLQLALKRNEIEYKSGKPISEWSLAR